MIGGMDMPGLIAARKGRGAASNASGRFEAEERAAFDDGWGSADDEPVPLATTLSVDATRTIIARNDSPDIGFDRSINPYRGCEHGCIYCYARPSHAYLGLSPGLDFESRLFYKPQAASLLAAELRKKGYACRPLALGSNTDPYQPVERRLEVTRSILEVLRDFRHPVTHRHQIGADPARPRHPLRDGEGPAGDGHGIGHDLDRALARVMEPRAATPGRRLETIAALAAAGVPTGVLSAPMIPALNDSEMEQILDRARAAGATSAGYTLLRLPLELKALFRGVARSAFPGQGGACALAGGASPWRPALRCSLVEADDRRRSLCRHAAPALRSRLPPARLRPPHHPASRCDPLSPAAAARRSAGAVLSRPPAARLLQ